MRNNLILLSVLALLIGAYFLFMYDPGDSSLDESEIGFAIGDTAQVTEIVLVKVIGGEDQQGIQLTKSEGGWQVNNRYYAFVPRIEKFLHVLSLIRVRDALPPKGQATAGQLLAQGHTRVEIFSEKGLIKAYEVGTEYKGGRGTLMQLEDADDAYVVELPGMQGYLNVYYSLDPNYWRENLLFHGGLSNLRSISVTYSSKAGSFELSRETAESPWKLGGDGPAANPESISAYFAQFTGKVYGETFVAAKYPGKFEALRSETPYATLSVAYLSGESTQVYLFERDDNPNSYFGWVEGAEELITVQHFVVDKYLAEKSDFLPPAL